MTDFLTFFLGGIPQGCVFALVAVGLVLIYKTTGVFNLAFGAQAYLAAAIFFKTNADAPRGWGWPIWLSFVFSVLIVSPLVGLFFDRAIFRRLRTAPWQVKLVSALGFVIAIPEIVKLSADKFPGWIATIMDKIPIFLGSSPPFNPPGIIPDGTQRVESIGGLDIGEFGFDRNEIATVIFTVIIVVLLALMFRYTAVGLQMRAVVESPRMVELAGVDADRVSAVAWMLSSTLAGLAGVLIVPLWATVDGNNFTILIVTAIAAAAFGRLTSIPLTFVGGLLLGVLMSLFAGYGGDILNTVVGWFVSDPDTKSTAVNTLLTGIRPGIPFIMLFVLLVFNPSLRGKREATDPLSGVDPPPPALASADLPPEMKRISLIVRYGFIAFIIGFVLLSPSIDFRGQQLLGFSGNRWTLLITGVLVTATVLLSITAFTGMSGQISLATATFAGIGAYTVGNLANNAGMDVTVAMLLGAAVSMVIGALLAIPALRLGGIFLTLATLAFGLLFSNVIFPLEAVSGGADPIRVPRPLIAAGDKAFFFYAFAVFAVAGFLVILVRSGTTGRFLSALRGSDVAAASIGINGTVARIVLFSLAAFIAGLGGGLRATFDGAALQTTEFEALFSIVFLVLVLNTAVRTVDGAVNAAFGFVVFLAFLSEMLGIPAGVGIILFGLGALTYARHPEGVAEFQKRMSMKRTMERREMARTEKLLKAEGELPPEVRSASREVLLSFVTLGVWTTVLVWRWYNVVRRERGVGLGGAYGLMVYLPLRLLGIGWLLAVLTNPERLSFFRFNEEPLNWVVLLLAAGLWAPLNLTAFLLPAEINKMCAERNIVAGIRWTAGVPVVLSGLVFLLLTSADAAYFGIFVLLIMGVAGMLSWVGGVQQALNAYFIAKGAQARAAEREPELVPVSSGGMTLVDGDGDPSGSRAVEPTGGAGPGGTP